MTEQVADAGASQTSDTSQAAASAAPAAAQQTALTAEPAKAAPAEGAQQQAGTEGQTAGADASSEGDKGVQQGAPEKYEFKAPEGTQLAEPVVSAFSEVAKELNLPQESAQKVIDKLAPIIAKQTADAGQAAFKQVNEGWMEATRTDKEFGGDKLDANLAVAKKALDAFGTPELRTLLNETGLGNNPELIRAFYRAGKAMSEDTMVPGSKSPPAAGKTDAATALYGKT